MPAQDLEAALRRNDEAIHAITAGEPGPYMDLFDDGPDVTLFGAWGPIERGAEAVRRTFEWVGGRFGPGGGLVSEREVVRASGSLACVVGFERGEVQVDGGPLVPMTIRVTQVYWRTDDEWRLVHRHADFPPRGQRRE
jgi:ketosteroid isomerase-like protein